MVSAFVFKRETNNAFEDLELKDFSKRESPKRKAHLCTLGSILPFSIDINLLVTPRSEYDPGLLGPCRKRILESIKFLLLLGRYRLRLLFSSFIVLIVFAHIELLIKNALRDRNIINFRPYVIR